MANLQNYLLVFFGAAFGGVCRYWATGAIHRYLPANFPYGTLFVNIAGSFVLGLVMFYLDARELLSPNMRLLLTVGFCGGFTTFSTFAFETVNLLRDAEFFFGMLNAVFNTVLSIAAVYAAYSLAKFIS